MGLCRSKSFLWVMVLLHSTYLTAHHLDSVFDRGDETRYGSGVLSSTSHHEHGESDPRDHHVTDPHNWLKAQRDGDAAHAVPVPTTLVVQAPPLDLMARHRWQVVPVTRPAPVDSGRSLPLLI